MTKETGPELKRYMCEGYYENGDMAEVDDGDWVRYTDAQAAIAAAVKAMGITVDKQGILFGENYWVSHETITGMGAEFIPTKCPQYFEWFNAIHARGET